MPARHDAAHPDTLDARRPRHLHVVPAPDPEPPYDDAPVPLRPLPQPAAQPPLPLLWVLPGGVPATPAVDDDFEVPVPTPGAALPPPGAWCARIVSAVVEVLHGVRPPGQLTRWLAPRVHADVAARAARRRTPARRAPVRIRSVHASAVGANAVEAAVVAVWGGRAHAVALRLEGLDGRWQVTALALG